MQKLFDVELDKVTSLTLKCSANILCGQLDENEHNLKSAEFQSDIFNPNTFKDHAITNPEYGFEHTGTNEKENYIPPSNMQATSAKYGNNANKLQRCLTTPFLNEERINVNNVHRTTQNLNQVTNLELLLQTGIRINLSPPYTIIVPRSSISVALFSIFR